VFTQEIGLEDKTSEVRAFNYLPFLDLDQKRADGPAELSPPEEIAEEKQQSCNGK
jgi:hypothetical protein